MPAQHRIRAYQQHQPVQARSRQRTEQYSQPRPIGRFEPDPLPTELALQHHELMPQSEDLRVLVAVTARQQP
jgi:hypothetical protein